jgi:hypothetical protein
MGSSVVLTRATNVGVQDRRIVRDAPLRSAAIKVALEDGLDRAVSAGTDFQSQPNSTAARLHLQMWDFGGQDIYHGTHVLFLHGPAVLMPVWAKDHGNCEIYTYGGLTFAIIPWPIGSTW